MPTRTCELCGGEMRQACTGGLFGARWRRWRCDSCTHEEDEAIYLRIDENSKVTIRMGR